MKQMIIKNGWTLILTAVMLFALCVVSSRSVAGTSTGEDLFKTKCKLCHNADGTPTSAGKALKARDLRSEDVQKQTDDELKAIITKGKNKMPAYGDKLTKDEVDQLVAYIRQLAPKQ